MRIEIDIPKEFEGHFNQDKFKDSFERIMADIKHSLENGDCLCVGRYEFETIEMLEKAFENSRQAYDINKVVKKLEENARPVNVIGYGTIYEAIDKDVAIKIVKQGGVSDDVCEWKIKDACYTSSIKHYDALPTSIVKTFTNCPYCSKKIKVVE